MKAHVTILHHPWIPDTVMYAWVAMAVILIPAIFVRWTLREVPSRIQNVLELSVELIYGLSDMLMGPEGRKYLPLFGSLFLFILVSNLLGLIPGCISPTANINTTIALALVVFFSYHFFGIYKQGIIRYLSHLCGPIKWLAPLMLPVEIISHLARPFSLSVRLFCNMMSKEIMIGILISLCPILLPLPIMLLGGLIVGPIQAVIFTLLAIIYVSGAVVSEEH